VAHNIKTPNMHFLSVIIHYQKTNAPDELDHHLLKVRIIDPEMKQCKNEQYITNHFLRAAYPQLNTCLPACYKKTTGVYKFLLICSSNLYSSYIRDKNPAIFFARYFTVFTLKCNLENSIMMQICFFIEKYLLCKENIFLF